MSDQDVALWWWLLGPLLLCNFAFHGIYNRFQRIVWNLGRKRSISDRSAVLEIALPKKIVIIGKLSMVLWLASIAVAWHMFGWKITLAGVVIWFFANMKNEALAPAPADCIAQMAENFKQRSAAAAFMREDDRAKALAEFSVWLMSIKDRYEHH